MAACVYIILSPWKGLSVGLFGMPNSLHFHLLCKFFFLDLLIDIADVIDIDVYTLLHNFIQIAKMFNLNIMSVGEFLLLQLRASFLIFSSFQKLANLNFFLLM